jgi:hypothetical protein
MRSLLILTLYQVNGNSVSVGSDGGLGYQVIDELVTETVHGWTFDNVEETKRSQLRLFADNLNFLQKVYGRTHVDRKKIDRAIGEIGKWVNAIEVFYETLFSIRTTRRDLRVWESAVKVSESDVLTTIESFTASEFKRFALRHIQSLIPFIRIRVTELITTVSSKEASESRIISAVEKFVEDSLCNIETTGSLSFEYRMEWKTAHAVLERVSMILRSLNRNSKTFRDIKLKLMVALRKAEECATKFQDLLIETKVMIAENIETLDIEKYVLEFESRIHLLSECSERAKAFFKQQSTEFENYSEKFKKFKRASL